MKSNSIKVLHHVTNYLPQIVTECHHFIEAIIEFILQLGEVMVFFTSLLHLYQPPTK